MGVYHPNNFHSRIPRSDEWNSRRIGRREVMAYRETSKDPEGRGNTGGMCHHRILVDKYHPVYFGKVGMTYFHKFRDKVYCAIFKNDQLLSIFLKDVKDKASKDNVPLIDGTQFGYFKVFKVLGKGKGVLPENQPVVVKAKLV